mgnify:CR=1 FL=1
MNQVATGTFTGSIVSLAEVFAHAGLTNLSQVVIRVDLVNIAGNGTYAFRVNIGGLALMPLTNFNVPSGTTSLVVYSKEVVLQPNEAFDIYVMGQAGDTAAEVTVRVFDVTPISFSQLSGTGATLVNHNYPNAGDMLVLDGNNAPIAGACIYIYTKADYDDGLTGPEKIVGQTTTTTDGEWAFPVALDAGDYYAYIFKQGVTAPMAVPFVVE